MKIRCEYKKLVPLSDLKPHPKNRNKHGADQIARLAQVFEYQGIRHPIIVSNLSGFIVAGHGRLAAAEKSGFKEFPVDYQEFGSVEEEYAFLVSDNAVALWAELDFSGINADLGDLGPDFDIDLLGIKNFEIDVADKDLADDPGAGEPPIDPKTKKGDVYRLGRHKLVCGDATNADDWAKIAGDGPTLVFTSPPYGVGDGAKLRQKYVRGAETLKSLYNDHDDNPDAWPQLMRDWTGLAVAHAQAVIANVQMLAGNKRELLAWMQEFAPYMVDIAIWDKGHGPPQMQANVLTNAFEFLFILSSEEGASRSVPMADFHGNQTNIARVSAHRDAEFAKIHKATMPTGLVEWAIELCRDAQHVIDPFGGTGTTMITAESRGISAGLIEMDPRYCDVIVERWEKFTGKKAYLEGGTAGDAP